MTPLETKTAARAEARFARKILQAIPSIQEMFKEAASYGGEYEGPITSFGRLATYRPKNAEEEAHLAWTQEIADQCKALHDAAAELVSNGRIVDYWSLSLDLVRHIEEEWWGIPPLHSVLEEIIREWLEWRVKHALSLKEMWKDLLQIFSRWDTKHLLSPHTPRRFGGTAPTAEGGWEAIAWDKKAVILQRDNGGFIAFAPRTGKCPVDGKHDWAHRSWWNDYKCLLCEKECCVGLQDFRR